jgi:putative Mn2+ efflux pump MntP
LLGFVLVLFGFLAPFLMTIGLVGSSFWLNFFSYAASIAGLLLGLIGAALYTRMNRDKD